MTPDFIFGVTPGDVVYDIETYPNVFTMKALHHTTRKRWTFEVSERRNDLDLIVQFMNTLAANQCRMVGFNNIGFDYPVIHMIHQTGGAWITVENIYEKAMGIIQGNRAVHTVWESGGVVHAVWESDWAVPQVDLFKIHHFDNMARSTSLKALEFAMRMPRIEDLPFPVGKPLTPDQIDPLLEYNEYDVDATDDFLTETKEMLAFREELAKDYGDDAFINYNDTKIGKQIFIRRLEGHTPGSCYQRINGRREPVQTIRQNIKLNDVILPMVKFTHPETNRILDYFQQQVITETKGVFKNVSCSINGFQLDFGTGGLHGSISNTTVTSDDEWIIEDWDVASYYPNLAIQNNLRPDHLGDLFCHIYADMYEQRKQHAKGSTQNAALKLGLNGSYGDSNNQYSPLFDPQFTMAITINGQLLLCMLIEALMVDQSVKMVQVNTDGLTIKYPREIQPWVHLVTKWWEGVTRLTLEVAEYKSMYIRDVNNYIAVYTDGSIKRKGAYEHNKEWHQDPGALIVPIAAEKVLVNGEDVREVICSHPDPYDFMLRGKAPGGSHLRWGTIRQQKLCRYYISTDGDYLEKVMPPKGPPGEYKRANSLTDDYYNSVMAEIGNGVWDERIHTKNKSVYETRVTGLHTVNTVQMANNMNEMTFGDIDYEWYIAETVKLTSPIMSNVI